MIKKVLVLARKSISSDCIDFLVKKKYKIIGTLCEDSSVKSPIIKIAQKYNIRLFKLNELNYLIKKKKINCEIGISLFYSKLIKEPLLSFPKFGFINFHPAPLPELKGTGGYNYAILNKFNYYGVSIHFMNEKIDDGRLIKVKKFKINKKIETVSSLENKSSNEILKLFKSFFNRKLILSKIKTYPNNGGVYISRKKMNEMKKIKKNDDIDTKVRAFWYPPYDGAYIIKNNVRYTLVNKKILNNLNTESSSVIYNKK